jgi:hypothetical protein
MVKRALVLVVEVWWRRFEWLLVRRRTKRRLVWIVVGLFWLFFWLLVIRWQ